MITGDHEREAPADWRPDDGPALAARVTFLEMTAKPAHLRPPPPPLKPHALLRVEEPPLPFCRWLYHETGRLWHWVDRKRQSDDEVAAMTADPNYHVYVLYLKGAPAGFFELDGRDKGEVDLALFGLMPHAIGQKLGPWLLSQAIDLAWSLGPERLTVNTCTLDHPKALALYQRLGFRPYAVADERSWPLSRERAARP